VKHPFITNKRNRKRNAQPQQKHKLFQHETLTTEYHSNQQQMQHPAPSQQLIQRDSTVMQP
jgi:hypothetical protein